MKGTRRIRTVAEPVFNDANRYPGIIAHHLTGQFGTGIPYLEWLNWMTNDLNKNSTHGKPNPMGHIIINQNPAHLIPPLKVLEKEEKLKELVDQPYSAARQREEELLRKALRENSEAIEKLDSAATQAIALIKNTSGPDVQSLLTNASIGHEFEPLKALSIFMLKANERYTGKAFDIKAQVMDKLNKIGYATNTEEVTMLVNQIQNVMKTARELLTKPNPAINPAALLAARVSHAAQQATILERNAALPPNLPHLQMLPLAPFVEPIPAVPVDVNSTMPTSQEVQNTLLDRIDSGNAELQGFRRICEVDIARSEPYQETMLAITNLLSTIRPSLNQRFDKVAAHRAAAAAVLDNSLAQHQFAQYDEEEQRLYEEEYQGLGSASASATSFIPKRQRLEDHPPAQCFFYDGTTGECDRERQTGSCPFHKGHYGHEPARSLYSNIHTLNINTPHYP